MTFVNIIMVNHKFWQISDETDKLFSESIENVLLDLCVTRFAVGKKNNIMCVLN